MSRAAIRYAKAILDMAMSKGISGEVNSDMEYIAKTIADNAELDAFIQSPVTAVSVKEKALLEVFPESTAITKGLFRLLNDNKRFEILASIAAEYNRQFEEMSGVEKAVVTTAVPLDEAMRAKVMSKVLEFSNKKVVIENIVNPEIIGGFVLRIGDKQYNASVANRLQMLKRELSN